MSSMCSSLGIEMQKAITIDAEITADATIDVGRRFAIIVVVAVHLGK